MNKGYNRTGSLFERNFRRKVVSSEVYFQKLIFYSHNNPVHHKFTQHIIGYPYTSYVAVISTKKTKLQRDKIIEAFGDVGNFKYYHSITQNVEEIESLIMDINSLTSPSILRLFLLISHFQKSTTNASHSLFLFLLFYKWNSASEQTASQP